MLVSASPVYRNEITTPAQTRMITKERQKPMKNMCLATSLPEEVLLSIFRFAGDTPTLFEYSRFPRFPLALVCQRWLAPARRALYEHLVPVRLINFIRLYESLRHHRPENIAHVRCLNFFFLWHNSEQCSGNCWADVIIEFEAPLIDLKLPLLYLHTASIEDFPIMDNKLVAVKTLRSLELSYISEKRLMKLWNQGFFSHLPNLKTLILSSCSLRCKPENQQDHVHNSGQRFPQLQSLHFKYCYELDRQAPSNWLNLAGSTLALKRLELCGIDTGFLEDNASLQLLRGLVPKLEHLAMYLDSWPERCWLPELLGVKIFHCKFELSRNADTKLPQYPPNVEELYVRWRCRTAQELFELLSVHIIPLLVALRDPASFSCLRRCPTIKLQCSLAYTDFSEQMEELLTTIIYPARNLAIEALQARNLSIHCCQGTITTVRNRRWIKYTILSG